MNQSKVSNISVVQKELRPNKIVNKGNSVFSNSHKYTKQSDKEYAKEKNKRMMEITGGSSGSNQGTMKLNVHSIKGANGSFRSSMKDYKGGVRDSLQSQSSQGPHSSSFHNRTTGPTIGMKQEAQITGDDQAVNSSVI